MGPSLITPSLFLSLVALSKGAVVDLLPPGNAPSLANHHHDLYAVPPGILGTSPIKQINVTLEAILGYRPLFAANFNPGGASTPLRDASLLGAQIDNDTHLLIAPSSNMMVSNVIETSDLFSVRLTFIEGITAFTGSGYLLRGVHSDEHNLTTVTWIVKYQDGSEKTFVDGIVPEPAAALLSLTGLAGGLLRRRRTP